MFSISPMLYVFKFYIRIKIKRIVFYAWRGLLNSREVEVALQHGTSSVGNPYADLATPKLLHPIREIATTLLIQSKNGTSLSFSDNNSSFAILASKLKSRHHYIP